MHNHNKGTLLRYSLLLPGTRNSTAASQYWVCSLCAATPAQHLEGIFEFGKAISRFHFQHYLSRL